MKIIQNPSVDTWQSLTLRPTLSSQALEATVGSVLNIVQELGDQALINYTNKFDGVLLKQVKYTLPKTLKGVGSELKNAIRIAHENILKFHRHQLQEVNEIETMPGVRCWRKSTPIEKVGLYIPGGSAPLFSSLLMLGVPAKIAGCSEIVVCTPPQKDGSVHPALLYTASILGIKSLYLVGGAQAIAAMAYGTESVPKVYKIFGPGNQYVTQAKQMVAGQQLAVDFPAGPSEVAILADDSADADFIASDLLSQAEHGVDSQVVLATNSEILLTEVLQSLEQQIASLPRKAIAKEALKQSRLVYFDDLSNAMQFINYYAPEHLIINTHKPSFWAGQVINAGSVFIGPYTPESAGDYASGTNHTLPTNGNARMYAGVSLDSFMKKITFQEITREGLEQVGPAVEIMAEAEGLVAHSRAVSIRRKKSKQWDQ